MYRHDVWYAADGGDRRDVAYEVVLSFAYSVALIAFVPLAGRSVYPSGAAFTTASVPILEPAPVRFSTTNCWPSRSDSD
jgi:hypothetical protein